MAYSIYDMKFSLLHCAQPIYCPIYTYAFLKTQKFQHSENLISLNIYQENIDTHHCILNLLQSRNSLVASMYKRSVLWVYIWVCICMCIGYRSTLCVVPQNPSTVLFERKVFIGWSGGHQQTKLDNQGAPKVLSSLQFQN